MDFQKAERPLADSTVYLVWERFPHEEPTLLAVFATYEAACIAADIYEHRKQNYKHWYDIEEKEILDQAPISKRQGTASTEVGEGQNPEPVPDAGT